MLFCILVVYYSTRNSLHSRELKQNTDTKLKSQQVLMCFWCAQCCFAYCQRNQWKTVIRHTISSGVINCDWKLYGMANEMDCAKMDELERKNKKEEEIKWNCLGSRTIKHVSQNVGRFSRYSLCLQLSFTYFPMQFS